MQDITIIFRIFLDFNTHNNMCNYNDNLASIIFCPKALQPTRIVGKI